MWAFIRRALIGGLLVWLPILATLYVLKFIIGLMDNSLSLLPAQYHPDELLGFNIPGIGVILAILILFFTGLFVGNFIGKKFVQLGEYILHRIPLVRSIYSAVKQVLETVLVPTSQSFRQVVLVKFPHPDSWTIAFLVGQGLKEVNKALDQDLLTVFVPTTPNPTSGYIVLVPRKDTIELSMSVDEALKFVISLGVVQPKKSGVIENA
jgi:uncharacterized membrane protein